MFNKNFKNNRKKTVNNIVDKQIQVNIEHTKDMKINEQGKHAECWLNYALRKRYFFAVFCGVASPPT